MKRPPLKVFYSYAHEDAALRDRIDQHLDLLARQNLIVGWHDRRIVPGTEWNRTIAENLASADIVLLLVSRAFMASDYVHDSEIPNAMRAHEAGTVRVMPVLVDDVPFVDAPFAKLELLPAKAKPISQWDDPVDAFRDIARGVRRAVKDIIIAGGGPFEFGPHEFTEAELSGLPKRERDRTTLGLERLRSDLNRTIPVRRYESNLLIATWALRQFGRPGQLDGYHPESLCYMAQVITSFDLVALQGVDRDMGRLEALVALLGPDWSVLVTDVAPGVKGNLERFAILYYKPRVEFRNFASQVVAPPKRARATTAVPQFARPPLIAAFRSAAMEFQVCTAHIVWGGSAERAMKERLEEVRRLGEYLKTRARYEERDLLLLGEFQMGERDSPILDALRASDVQVPDELLHPTNLEGTRYYDLIGFASPARPMPLETSHPHSGAYDLFQHVLRDEDRTAYQSTASFRTFAKSWRGGPGIKRPAERKYRMWKSFLISDHLPLWAELLVDRPADD